MGYKKQSSKLFKAALAASVTTGAFVVTAPVYTEAATPILKDLQQEQYYYDAVNILLNRGILHGYPDLTYRPQEPVTRGQAAIVLANYLGLDLKDVKNPGFTDVNESHKYYSSIAALVEKGIIQGYEDGTFREEATLTRAEMAKMIAIGFDLNLDHPVEAHIFSDVKEDSVYSIYVQALLNYDITKGIMPNLFGPSDKVTRGQIASFIIRGEEALATPLVSGEIVKIEDDKLTLSTSTYIIPETLAGIFNSKNMKALTGASVELNKDGRIIQSIQSLELVESGELQTNIVFDGDGNEIAGDLIVNGNSIKVQNVNVNNHLNVISNDFYADNLVVKGNTRISNENAVETETPITFNDSVLSELIIDKEDVTLNFQGNTSVTNTVITSNAKLQADNEYSLPMVTISDDVKHLTTNIVIENLIAKGNETLTIDGTGRVNLFGVYSNAGILVDFDSIDTMEIHVADAKVSVGRKTIIGHLRLPLHTAVTSIIQNYEDIRKNIEMIDGEANAPLRPE